MASGQNRCGALTGDVTSWTRCRSVAESARSYTSHGVSHTNVEQYGSIESLVDDVLFEDLVVQSLWSALGGRHAWNCKCGRIEN